MSTDRVTVHVAHAAWLPERAQTLERLLDELAPQLGKRKAVVHRSEQREHSSVWATRVYAACEAERSRAQVVLNDDVKVSPDLLAAVEAMCEQPTSRFISLHTVHPMARSLAESGQRWLRAYHVTGPAYLLREGAAGEALQYYAETPKAWNTRVQEDNVLSQLAYRHREPVWQSIPALVTHDTSVPSSLGTAEHAGRMTQVAWDDADLWGDQPKGWLRDAAGWRTQAESIPVLPTQWGPVEALARQEACNALGIAPEICFWCAEKPAVFGSPKTGARICHQCFHATFTGVLNAALKVAQQNMPGPQ